MQLSHSILLLGALGLSSLCAAPSPKKAEQQLPPPVSTEPTVFCRFVPERKDDFAWENDLVAFRVYGPALRPGPEDSGIDCWPKRVPYPIINRWYAGEQNGVSYHKDHGEGFDFYHVGSSRGCGGTALWQDDKMVLADTYLTWKILSTSKSKCEFELTYDYAAAAGEPPIHEVKKISLELGQRFFRSESIFTRAGKPVADLPVAIGITTHDDKAAGTLSPTGRWIACWEQEEGEWNGTGAILAPGQPIETRAIHSPEPDHSHVIMITKTNASGRVVHYAGFAWTKSCAISSAKEWAAALDQFSQSLK